MKNISFNMFLVALVLAMGFALIIKNQDTAINHILLGNNYFDKGEYNKAITEYTKAIRINPNSLEAYNKRGMAYIQSGNSERILIKPEILLSIWQSGSSNPMWIKVCEQYDKAIADFTKVIKLKPNFAEAYNNRGFTYYWKLKHDEAIMDYTKAININPMDVNFYINRGLAYYEKGDFINAQIDYQKTLELDPGNETGLALLTESEKRLKEKNK